MPWRPPLAVMRDFESKRSRSREEFVALQTLCKMISPDLVINIIFIQNNKLTSKNKFEAVNSLHKNKPISGNIVIDGERHAVKKIMQFQPIWIVEFWLAPMRYTPAWQLWPVEMEEKATRIRDLVPEIVPIEDLIRFDKQPPLRQLESSFCSIL